MPKKVVILITAILYFLCVFYSFSKDLGFIFSVFMPPFFLLGLALFGVAVIFMLASAGLLLAAFLEGIWNIWKSLKKIYSRGSRRT